jgi:hypothetical protein
MSAHGTKSMGRHPAPVTYERKPFPVANVTFEVDDHPKNGRTFGLFVGLAEKRKRLFSGHIEKGMAAQLRRLAHHIEAVFPASIEVSCKKLSVAHVTFEVIADPDEGCTFGLFAGEAVLAQYRKRLFSAPIEPGMGTQLRRLAHHIDHLEAKL